MRTHILATILFLAPLLFAAGPAWALPQPVRPAMPAPVASAPFQQREQWCATYANWLITHTPTQAAAPSDVRPTQRYEVEFNSCKLDPQQYERDTRLEAQAITQSLRG